jgi:hypothetical protein
MQEPKHSRHSAAVEPSNGVHGVPGGLGDDNHVSVVEENRRRGRWDAGFVSVELVVKHFVEAEDMARRDDNGWLAESGLERD